MSKEKAGLGNFKISDAVKKPVTPAAASQMKKKGGEKQEEAPSAGFPHIEGIIEAGSLDKSGLKTRMEALEQLAKSGDQKQKAGARKALLAYEQVEGLLDYLWSTKEKLAGGGAEDSKAKAPKPAAKGSAKPAPKGAKK